jgi:hypothetical protein
VKALAHRLEFRVAPERIEAGARCRHDSQAAAEQAAQLRQGGIASSPRPAWVIAW